MKRPLANPATKSRTACASSLASVSCRNSLTRPSPSSSVPSKSTSPSSAAIAAASSSPSPLFARAGLAPPPSSLSSEMTPDSGIFIPCQKLPGQQHDATDRNAASGFGSHVQCQQSAYAMEGRKPRVRSQRQPDQRRNEYLHLERAESIGVHQRRSAREFSV